MDRESSLAFVESDLAMPWYAMMPQLAIRSKAHGIDTVFFGHGGDDFMDGTLDYLAR
jgi:hypothetical protein